MYEEKLKEKQKLEKEKQERKEQKKMAKKLKKKGKILPQQELPPPLVSEQQIEQAIELAIAIKENNEPSALIPDYTDLNVSIKVIKIIQSLIKPKYYYK